MRKHIELIIIKILNKDKKRIKKRQIKNIGTFFCLNKGQIN